MGEASLHETPFAGDTESSAHRCQRVPVISTTFDDIEKAVVVVTHTNSASFVFIGCFSTAMPAAG